MTVTEARAKYGEKNINNASGGTTGMLTVAAGKGRLYTYNYDASLQWASNSVPTAGADGKIIIQIGAEPVVGTVIKVPTSDDLALGIDFNV
jgi:hypothetical protein